MNNGTLSVDEALAFLLEGARPVTATEKVPTLAATGRVLAQAQYSTLTVPAVDNTSMDGYAVYAADCASGASSPARQYRRSRTRWSCRSNALRTATR